MIFEKQWPSVPIQSLTADGTVYGVLTISDTKKVHVGQLIILRSNAQTKITVLINRISSNTTLEVGLPGHDSLNRVDVSAFLVADSASFICNEQNRPKMAQDAYERATYAEEPIVAKRSILVDEHGEYYNSDNPLPINADGVSITVALDAFAKPAPDNVISVGTEDGTKNGTPHSLKIGSDLKLEVKDTTVAASLSSVDTKLSSQATAAKQDTGNTSLGSIDGKLTSTNTKLDTIHTDNAVIEGKQDTGNVSLASIDTKLSTTNAHLTTIEGYVDGLEGLVTSSNTKLDTLHTDLGVVEGKQDTGNTSLSSVDGKLTSTNTKLDTLHTDFGTVEGKQDLGNTSLSSIDTKATSTNTKLDTLHTDFGVVEGKQDTGNTSLSSIDTKLSTTNTEIGATNETAPGSDTATVGINGRLQRVAQNVTSSNTKLDTLHSDLTTVEGKQDTGNTSLSSIDGKLTSTNTKLDTLHTDLGVVEGKQDTGNTSLSSIDTKLTSQATAAKQDTGNTSLSSIDTKTPALGQTTAAGSRPVVIASDQISTTIAGGPSTGLSTDIISSTDVSKYRFLTIQFAGTVNGTTNAAFQVQISNDNVTFYPVTCTSITSTLFPQFANINNNFILSSNPLNDFVKCAIVGKYMRVRITGFTGGGTGSVSLTAFLSNVDGTGVPSGQPGVSLTDNLGNSINGNQAVAVADSAGTAFTLGAKTSVNSLPVVIASDQANIGIKLRDGAGTSVPVGRAAAASSLPVAMSNEDFQDLSFTGQSAQTATVNNIIPVSAGASATDVTGYKSGSIQIVSTGTGGTFIFEGSNDNSNFQAIPVYSQLILTGTPITAAITPTSSQLIYTFPINFRYIRCRIATTITGGSIQAFSSFKQAAWSPGIFQVAQATAANLNATVTATNLSSNIAQVGGTNVVNAGVAGVISVGGNVAHSTAATTNPVQTGGRVVTTLDTSLVQGDAAYNAYTSAGQHISKPYGSRENDWSYAAANLGIVNTTVAVTIKAAGAASIRNHITSIQIMSEALGAATEFAIRDGAAGTVLWRIKISASGILSPISIVFPSPLVGSTATLLEIVTLTASITGAVYFNAQGYQAF